MIVTKARFSAFVIAAGFFMATPAYALMQSAPLAPGEVTLQISARGVANTPPDTIMVTASVTDYADTAETARGVNEAKVARLTRALIARGIDSRSISAASPPRIRFDPAPPPMIAPPVIIAPPPPRISTSQPPQGTPSPPVNIAPRGPLYPSASRPQKSASTNLQLKLASRAELQVARSVFDAEEVNIAGNPRYSLSDDRVARPVAIADAIARARADAETYASRLGMRIVRIARVSNQPVVASVENALASIIANQAEGLPDIVTAAYATIDFILAPR